MPQKATMIDLPGAMADVKISGRLHRACRKVFEEHDAKERLQDGFVLFARICEDRDSAAH